MSGVNLPEEPQPWLFAAVAAAVIAVLSAILLGILLKRERRAQVVSEFLLNPYLAGLLRSARDGIVIQAPGGRIVAVNERAAQLLGLKVDTDSTTYTPEDLGTHLQHLNGGPVLGRSTFGPVTVAVDGPTANRSVTVQSCLPDGSIHEIDVQTTTYTEPTGEQSCTIHTLIDLAREADIVNRLVRSQSQFQVAMDNAPIGMALLSPDLTIREANQAFASILGSSPKTLSGLTLRVLMHPEDRQAEARALRDLMTGQEEHVSFERRFIRADEQIVWLLTDIAMVKNQVGEPDVLVAQFRDATESRLQAEVLVHRAMHDPLTGLANRALLQEELRAHLADPLSWDHLVVLALDLDGFKAINDRLGHHAGDELLVYFSAVLRQLSGDRSTVARLGGDEFIVVMTGRDSVRRAHDFAAGVHRALSDPIRIDGTSVEVKTSIGVVVTDYILAADGVLAILQAADAALYRAKAMSSGRTVVYEPSMSDPAHQVIAIEQITEAIHAGQIVTHFQPVVNLDTREVSGYEALARWQHPERGLVQPSDFLPAIHEAGLATQFNDAILEHVLDFLHRTSARGRWVSVNVSPDQMGDGTFAAQVSSGLARYRIQPGRFVVELTEQTLVTAASRVRHELLTLRGGGIPVLLDDFGTGISPLSYLRDLPVSGVKLDRSFVSGIPEDPAASKVVRGLSALAHEMRIVAMAEGIETEEQARYLAQHGWRHGQGWLFGSAQPAQTL